MLTLLPFVLTAGFALMTLLLSGKRGASSTVFTYSKLFKGLSWIAFLLPPAIWYAFWLRGVRLNSITTMMCMVVDFGLLLAACNIYIYRIVVEDDWMEIFSFGRLKIRFEDIHLAEVRGGGNGSLFLFIDYGNSKKYSISAYLEGFDQLVDLVKKKSGRSAIMAGRVASTRSESK